MTKDKTIQNIVFDMGGVLIEFPGDAVSRLRLSRADEALFRREVLGEEEWICLDEGTMTEEAACQSICMRIPSRLHQAVREFIWNWWKGPLRPITGMDELIKELKEEGYAIYLLSNAGIHHKEYFDRLPGSQYFSGRIISGEHQMLKPFAAIYRKLLDQYDLQAPECFFIDDSGINVHAARKLGMQGVIFHGDIARLRRQMQAIGIRVRE